MVSVAAIAAFAKIDFSSMWEYRSELNRANLWAKQCSRSKFELITVTLRGEQFGISNIKMTKIDSNRWVAGYDTLLQHGYFVYPPGKYVSSIEDAFAMYVDYKKGDAATKDVSTSKN
jgi:hypothetical protein